MLNVHAQTVEDLLSDSIVQAVMRADRVDADSLKGMLEDVAQRLSAHRRHRALTPAAARGRLGPERRATSACDVDVSLCA